MQKLIPCVSLLLILSASAAPSAGEPQELAPLDDDERLLESAGIPSEGAGLLEFFRARAQVEAEPGRIEELVRRLTGPSFPERVQAGCDLVAMGPLAIPGLRRVANDLESPEVRARARQCLIWVEGPQSANLPAAAARVVARRKPAGAAEALLAYVPFADNENVAREVAAALQAVAMNGREADPVLLRALSDPVSLRRAVAGAVLGQTAPPEQRQAVEKLLHDANPEVRLATAVAMAKAHNAAAVPVLIDLVALLPANKRGQVEEVLQELAGEWAPTGGPMGEDEIARRIRRDAWAAWWANTDGPALLEMLGKRTLTPVEQEKVKGSIRRLGDPAYSVREKAVAELVARGTMVLPMLREALKGSELEVTRRAQRCIQRIEEEPAHRLPAAALRLLALRKPAGAVEALLAYVPFAEDENLSEAQSALAKLALRDGKPEPALMRALAAPQVAVRAAAAEALAQAGGPDGEIAIHKLLADADLTLRRRVALALAPRDARERIVRVLISLIAVLDGDQANQVHDFLVPLAGEKPPPAPEDNLEARKKASADWEAWWKENAGKVDLAKLANPQQHWLGFTLICEVNTGQMMELGRDRKPRWSFGGVQYPTDAWVLPNNRILIAEYNAQKVTERDLKGNILSTRQVQGQPLSVQRLPNGNTLVATNQQILEYDRAGKDVRIINNLGPVNSAFKARNGEIIYLTQNGACGRLDAAGKPLKSFSSPGARWMELLPNGRILITQPDRNKVVEYDLGGKLLLEVDIPQVNAATGLPNGNILAACHNTNRVIEVDRKGKVLWEHKVQTPFRARGR